MKATNTCNMNDGVGQLTETTASTNRRRMWDRNRKMDTTTEKENEHAQTDFTTTK